jgi:UDP-N-acetylmuramoyl-L-alanyl-D-glutamate--2,6-diaminopimelate ligase
VVFGAGGDRDRGKRPEMGAVAERYADRVVLTSDNPRSEEPAAILREIGAGLSRPSRAVIEPDRGVAIAWVARSAAAGDVIVVAGKGHETVQIVEGEVRPFDDRIHLREALARRRGAAPVGPGRPFEAAA